MAFKSFKSLFLFVVFALLFFSRPSAGEVRLGQSQILYVPVYSSVYFGARGNFIPLSVVLSIRNTDLFNKISIRSVEFYDNDGKLVKEFLPQPMLLFPMASHHIFINENENSGGLGANFIVRWKAEKDVNFPLVECVMVGTKSGQGITFTSSAREITDQTR